MQLDPGDDLPPPHLSELYAEGCYYYMCIRRTVIELNLRIQIPLKFRWAYSIWCMISRVDELYRILHRELVNYPNRPSWLTRALNAEPKWKEYGQFMEDFLWPYELALHLYGEGLYEYNNWAE